MAARVLTKEELGSWALIQVVVGFLAIFQDGGVGNYVIRHPDYNAATRRMARLIGLLAGVLAGIALAAVSIPVTFLMGISSHWKYFLPLVLTFSLGGLTGVLNAELRRELRFRELFMATGLATLLFVPVTWMMLAKGWGLWSYTISSAALTSVQVSFLALRLRPLSLGWGGALFSEIVVYTRGLLGFNIINYWARSADNLLVGRFLGPAPLAVYANAYRIMLIPITQVISTLNPLMLPYLAKYANDKEGQRRELFGFVRLIGCIVFPPMTFLWLERDFLVRIYLGPGWSGVADLLAWFVPIGMLQCLINPLGNAYLVAGRNDEFFKIGVINTVVIVLSFVCGLPFGVKGVAIGYLVANLIMCFPIVHRALRMMGSSFNDWIMQTSLLWFIPGLSLVISYRFSEMPSPWDIVARGGVTLLISLLVVGRMEGKALRRWLHVRRSGHLAT
ncbi:lipopolysaccharide biosynthesis protein WzxC [Haloferula sargassicola]|uniref:Lipopolysaccharide biosynthesis protein WzxC n=2 Tax=Haloferula sargassicola TaxID=490096 RepID=A0ABP9UWD9_9BACT